MGLTRNSTGRTASNTEGSEKSCGKVIALIGNPNVGKSTLFNALTGMNQHTGNWTGKTVVSAVGTYSDGTGEYTFVDLPGCYSLNPKSAEEEVSRDFVCFGDSERTVTVCDASCLERNLYLALQIIECSDNSTVCVNLIDEADKRGIAVDCEKLSKLLGVPVVSMNARNGKEAYSLIPGLSGKSDNRYEIKYETYIEEYISDVYSLLIGGGITRHNARYFAVKSLDSSNAFVSKLSEKLGINDDNRKIIRNMSENFKSKYGEDTVTDSISKSVSDAAHQIAFLCVSKTDKGRKTEFDRKIDGILTGKYTAFPIMLLLMLGILWLTVKGANYPSSLLSVLFNKFENASYDFLTHIGVNETLCSFLCDGIIRVIGWVVSVMLPPMAIFFPLFTFLEDIGYLPRVAFNIDRCFKKCSSCGKQALTMCMGFGCNAAGVVGCRIIDSPRERMIAILTNSFMPCNGRFPILIAIISVFFAAASGLASSALLCGIIVFAVLMTLGVSKLLSVTVLKGIPSSFALELPPYRKPQIGKIIVRSLLDRTIFVLGRAVAVAAPTGAVIWLLVNVRTGNETLLSILSGFLDPVGILMGLDGVILLAFILGLPANEIVIPIILMCYSANTDIVGFGSYSELKDILTANGWGNVTAINMLIFTVFHWPCSTTLLTIKKETGSIRHMFSAALIPTAVGFVLCCAVNLISKLI